MGATIAPNPSDPTVREHLNDNTAQVSGTITRLWLQDRDIHCRLRTKVGGQTNCMTLLFPGGLPLDGQPVSLAPNKRVLVTGYIRYIEYTLTLAELLQRAGWPKLIKPGDEVIRTQHDTTRLVVQTCAPPRETDVNESQLSGIVAKIWHRIRCDDVFASLAVYDEHTAFTGGVGNRGLPRREANYVRVIFPDGLTSDGMPVKELEPRRLAIVAGPITNSEYSESVANLLRRANCAERIDETLKDRRYLRSMLRVQANRLVICSQSIPHEEKF